MHIQTELSHGQGQSCTGATPILAKNADAFAGVHGIMLPVTVDDHELSQTTCTLGSNTA